MRELDQLLKLDFDVIVPSVGPLLARADLVAFKVKVDTLVARANALMKQGVSKDQLLAQLKTDDLGWRLNFRPINSTASTPTCPHRHSGFGGVGFEGLASSRKTLRAAFARRFTSSARSRHGIDQCRHEHGRQGQLSYVGVNQGPRPTASSC